MISSRAWVSPVAHRLNSRSGRFAPTTWAPRPPLLNARRLGYVAGTLTDAERGVKTGSLEAL
jgi:hypothetical protein